MIYSIEGTIWKIEQKNKLFKLVLGSVYYTLTTLDLETTGTKKYILNTLTLDNHTVIKQLISWCSGLKKSFKIGLLAII